MFKRLQEVNFHKVLLGLFALAFFIFPNLASAVAYSSPTTSGQNNLYHCDSTAEASTNANASTNCRGAIASFLRFGEEAFGDGCINSLDKGPWESYIKGLPKGTPVDVKCKADSGPSAAVISSLLNLMQQRPASAVMAMDDVMNKLFRPDYIAAQELANIEPYFPGTGFDLLRPVQALWGWSVTVAYSLMIIIVIIVAIALLFRNKLPGGQVVDIQSAIPNIVLAMILIPLSYPITGLFIDGITLGGNIIHGAFFSESGFARSVYENGEYGGGFLQGDIAEDQRGFAAEGTRGLFIDDLRLTPFNVRGAFISSLEFDKIFTKDDRTITCVANSGVPNDDCINVVNNSGPIAAVTDGILGLANSLPGWLNPIFQVLFSIITIVTAVRIMWKLIKQFLFIMFLPPLAPFWFVSIAIPGTGTKTIMQYLRMLGSVTATYLVTYMMFLMALVLASDDFQRGIPGYETSNYSPPLIGFGGADNIQFANKFIFSILAAAVYLSVPGVIDSIRSSFGVDTAMSDLVKRPFNEFNSARKVAFRQAPGLAVTAGRRVGSIGTRTVGGAFRGVSSARRFVRGPGADLKVKGDVFSGSKSGDALKANKKEYASLRQRADQTSNPYTKARLLAKAAIVARSGNISNQFNTGEETTIQGKQIGASAYNTEIEIYNARRTGKSSSFQVAMNRIRSSAGKVFISEKNSDGDGLTGTLKIKRDGNVIGVLKPPTGNSEIKIIYKGKDPVLASKSSDDFDISLEFKEPLVPNVNYSTGNGSPVTSILEFSESNRSPKSELHFSITLFLDDESKKEKAEMDERISRLS